MTIGRARPRRLIPAHTSHPPTNESINKSSANGIASAAPRPSNTPSPTAAAVTRPPNRDSPGFDSAPSVSASGFGFGFDSGSGFDSDSAPGSGADSSPAGPLPASLSDPARSKTGPSPPSVTAPATPTMSTRPSGAATTRPRDSLPRTTSVAPATAGNANQSGVSIASQPAASSAVATPVMTPR